MRYPLLLLLMLLLQGFNSVLERHDLCVERASLLPRLEPQLPLACAVPLLELRLQRAKHRFVMRT